jgi:hypothetical protein
MDAARKSELIPFDDAVKELWKEFPGKVTVVSYESIKFARDCGIDVWEFAGSMKNQLEALRKGGFLTKEGEAYKFKKW